MVFYMKDNDNKNLQIGFVIPWVDGSDENWIKELKEYFKDKRKEIDYVR